MFLCGNHDNFVPLVYQGPKLYLFFPLFDHVDGVGHVNFVLLPVPRTETEADVSYCFP